MKVEIELFYSPFCPYCPKAKEIVREVVGEFEKEVKIQEINVLSFIGNEKAKNYGIRAVPTLIVNGRTKIMGIPKKEQLRKAIQQELTLKDY